MTPALPANRHRARLGKETIVSHVLDIDVNHGREFSAGEFNVQSVRVIAIVTGKQVGRRFATRMTDAGIHVWRLT